MHAQYIRQRPLVCLETETHGANNVGYQEKHHEDNRERFQQPPCLPPASFWGQDALRVVEYLKFL